MAKKKSPSKKDIIALYMDYVLENGQNPKSVFMFSKLNNFDESEFYGHFASFQAIEKEVFNTLFTNSMEVINKNENYQNFDVRNKLLSFYFTFFENLTANRSYVIHVLSKCKSNIKGLKVLSGLKQHFTHYISELELQLLDLKNGKLEKLQNRALQESAWLHLMSTMKFWMDDTSTSFEKTDIFIEKSVNASFDLLDIAPLKSVIDLGKFLYKEKFQMR